MGNRILQDMSDSDNILTLKHLIDTYQEKGKHFQNYIPYNIECFKKLGDSTGYDFTYEETRDSGELRFKVDIQSIINVKSGYAHFLQIENPEFYNNYSQEKIIKSELENILERKNNCQILYPQDFSIIESDIENIEYIRTLLRLELNEYYQINFPESSTSSFYGSISRDKNIVFNIRQDKSIKKLGSLTLDKKLQTISIGNRKVQLSDLNNSHTLKKGFITLATCIEKGWKELKYDDATKNILSEYSYDLGRQVFHTKITLDTKYTDITTRLRKFLKEYGNNKVMLSNLENGKYTLLFEEK